MNIPYNIPLNSGIHNNGDNDVIGEIIVMAKAFRQAQVSVSHPASSDQPRTVRGDAKNRGDVFLFSYVHSTFRSFHFCLFLCPIFCAVLDVFLDNEYAGLDF